MVANIRTHLLARSTTIVLQRRVNGDTTTEHGSRIRAVQTIRNVEDKAARVTSISRVTTIGLAAAILVLVAVCVCDIQAVVLLTILAVLALSAAV